MSQRPIAWRKMLLALGCLLVSAGYFSVTLARAANQGTLPEIELVALDGTAIKSTQVVHQGNWFLLYVQPGSRSCAALLESLTKEQYPGLAGRLAIIVGGTPDQTRALSQRFPELADSGWYADEQQVLASKLQIHGAPVTLAMANSSIVWSANGKLNDPAIFHSAVMKWLGQ